MSKSERKKSVELDPQELQVQRQIIAKMNEKNLYNMQQSGKQKKAMIVTYGCQMNEHDSEKLLGMLKQMAYEETDKREDADLIIFNTCCVRENAELKVYGNIGALKNLKKKNNDLNIAVCGCMMQQPEIVSSIKKKYPFVDLVFGTHNIHRFPELLANSQTSNNMLVEVWEEEGEIIEGVPSMRKYGLKAFVNIMFGCNNFCTYCIVPYTRGRERSRNMDDIIEEVKNLAENGTKEITLLGQNVNSYGKTLEGNIQFADLLLELNKVEGIERIRFMTSHPKDLSEPLIDAIASGDKLCEHIHLPFQAGSNNVLKTMNRGYTKESYLALVEKIKSKIPGVTLTTDIIVGFPGESDEDFEDTLDLVRKVRFDSAFTFLYSIRKGTPAAEMKEQVDDKVKHERFNRLVDEVNKISAEINQGYIGKVVEVLVEDRSKTNTDKLMGRTRQNKLVNFNGDESLIGQIVKVKIIESKTFSLNGEVTK
ncbi:tRNA (N6-isopentenyl adenosine(37)-C2)-methylthiotransferase MiaB [Serpentinicella alkaliphila]|uniref:tRNA-2-methylthio-N(6)-dimethylallyladenosine synthase n=1 Tax=Serpentinicella alkaliphila TaxID=1734049 RepID=A0A4R2T456_9FIRM|nr:tRNA (N6-isopentenyl adenosine(37)-C2)-methylthiotransferase MiaB [Serpentinicella alkaliphila]QUH26356.1 tRNA (N6-isopentenyl adenosine(37)-C2)-methylthiotransferase MiaB [Serpentinicella alkaliphila]TCP96785.1 tRNA-i(6)A37 thiotransferase enzyme MiaB [Serpentinicella alkaliphila]